MRADHPIFNGPLSVPMTFDKEPVWEPEADKRGTWLIQNGKTGPENDYGVVSDGVGFEDSPDCEIISGGINSKGPHGVAVGRQANLLQWGFYCAPDRMTASARHAFLNAIVYMKRFDGRRPLVAKKARSRGWLKHYVAMVGELDGKYKASGDDFRKYLEARFPADVIAKHGLDAAKLEAWRAANEEYVYATKPFSFGMDADLARLGLSNRKPEFLDWLVKRLAADASDALALKLATRYLGEHGKDAATALAYVRDNRDRLFFSDTGGFRWFVDTSPPAPTSRGPSPASR